MHAAQLGRVLAYDIRDHWFDSNNGDRVRGGREGGNGFVESVNREMIGTMLPLA